MSKNKKERLLNDLQALQSQLAHIDADSDDDQLAVATTPLIPTLEVDNIPVLGDAIPANKEEAINAHREAMAILDDELKALDPKDPPKEPESQSLADAPNDKEEIKDMTSHGTLEQKPIFQEYKLNMPQPIPINASLFAPITAKDIAEDNPFLPQHLRERLNQSKSSLLEGIARSSESLDASTALLRNFTGANAEALKKQAPNVNAAPQHTNPSAAAQNKSYQQPAGTTTHQLLIDALVAKYLPMIESELRNQLADTLKNKSPYDSK